MTQTPGTPAYMPPEVMVANPKYDTSIDEFSYGILMIHMFSGKWPEPQVGPSHTEPDGRLIQSQKLSDVRCSSKQLETITLSWISSRYASIIIQSQGLMPVR